MTVTDDRPDAGPEPGDDKRRMLTLDDLRGKTPEELYEVINLADAHITDLHKDERGAIRTLNDAEKGAMKTLLEVREAAEKKLEEHREIMAVLDRRPKSVRTALSTMGHRDDDPFSDVRRLTPAEARERALRRLDDRSSTAHMSAEQKTEVERQLRKDPDIARRILVTETDAYRNAWMRLVTQPDAALFLSDEERDAVRGFNEYRAMAEWTTTAGGFGVPVNQAA